MPVSTKHAEYKNNVSKWELTRDCAEGSQSVKNKGAEYLPVPCPTDPDASARYADYKKCAVYVNFTGPTLKGLIDMVFREDTNIELAPGLEYLEENANGSGLTLDQLIRRVVSDDIITGRVGLLVDYPSAPDGLTLAQTKALSLRANIVIYPAESIINWRTTTEGGVTKTSLVVLQEPTEIISDDGFAVETKIYHRVLRYEDGAYSQELYNEADVLIGANEPRKADGSRWSEIPFIVAGSENNDLSCDEAPLYDIAELNLAHYRNSAYFEESCFMVGQPTPVVKGLTDDWAKEILKDGIRLGSRTGLLLPVDGDASLLQVNDNLMPERGMAAKESQLMKIGARIIQDARGNETENAARMRYAGQTSPLSAIVGNVESAFRQCLKWCAEFMGVTGDSKIDINREFYDRKMDAQSIMANIALLDRGAVAMTDLRSNLRASGVLDNDRTDEEIDGEAEQANPL